jgi:hypothetical protein
MKKEGKQSTAIENYVKPVILYYKMNDVILNTRKVNRFLPEKRSIKKDRAYYDSEISKMLEIADERIEGCYITVIK